MASYVIVTDSSADLSAQMAEEAGVQVLPLRFTVEGQTYYNWPDNREMDPKVFYRMLREEEIWHEITEHPAVYNMEEMAQIQLPYPEADAKNLFVRDSKRRDYYLITVRGDKRVDLKQFRQQNQTRSLSFASAEELGELLGLIPGAVTPLGLLNDGDRRVSFYLDASFCRPEAQKIGVHPNDNTATLWLQVEDLLRLIRAHGNPVHVVPI